MRSKVSSFYSFINKKYPFRKAEKWDFSGITIGDENKIVSNVVVALDLTTDAMDFAIKNKADLIITHHPFVWKDLETSIAEAPYKKEIWRRLNNTGISVIAAHTNYDYYRMSWVIMEKLGFKAKAVPGVDYGLLVPQKIKYSEVEKTIKEKLDLEFSQTNVIENKLFKNFAILPGAGSPVEIIELNKKGVELIITSDIKWSTWIMAQQESINLVQVSHKIEEVFVDDVADSLKKKFKNINIFEYKI